MSEENTTNQELESVVGGLFYGEIDENSIFPFPRFNEDQVEMAKAMTDAIDKFAEANIDSEKFDGIILYSLFQLPEIKTDRLVVAKTLLDKQKQLHCAVENIQINNINDFNEIDLIWQIKKTL